MNCKLNFHLYIITVNPEYFVKRISILGDPEVTANMYCKLRNLPNTDTENDSTDMR